MFKFGSLGLAPQQAITPVLLGTNVQGSADGAYSWWMSRNAFKSAHGNHVIFGYMEQATTNQVVAQMDLATGSITSTFTANSSFGVDDHSPCAVDEFANGQICAAYTGHQESSTVEYRVSSDGDPANFGAAVTALSPGDTVSYAQLYVLADDTIFCLCRTDQLRWDISKSTDKGATWTRKKRLYIGTADLPTASQYYLQGRLVGNELYCFAPTHPSNDQNLLKLFKINLATGAMSDSGGAIGNLDDGTNDTALSTYANLTTLRTPAAGKSQRLFDISEDCTAVVLGEFDNATGLNAKLIVLRFTGDDRLDPADWTEMDPGVNIGLQFGTNATCYFGGATFDRADLTGNSMFICRESSHARAWLPGIWTLEKLVTADSWGTVTATIIKTHGTKMIRPVSPRGAVAGVGRVFWQEGSLAVANPYTDYNVWTLSIKAGPGVEVASAIAEQSESTTLFAAMGTAPSASERRILNEFIYYLKNAPLAAGDLWAKIDRIYYAGHDQTDAFLNLKSPGGTKLTVGGGTPVLTANQKWAVSEANWLDTGHNPSSASDALNTGLLGELILSNQQGSSGVGGSDGTNQTILNMRSVTDSRAGRINATTSTANTGGSSTDSRGFGAMNRTASNANNISKNGVAQSSSSGGAQTPSARVNATLKWGRTIAGTGLTHDAFLMVHSDEAWGVNDNIDLYRAIAVLYLRFQAL